MERGGGGLVLNPFTHDARSVGVPILIPDPHGLVPWVRKVSRRGLPLRRTAAEDGRSGVIALAQMLSHGVEGVGDADGRRGTLRKRSSLIDMKLNG